MLDLVLALGLIIALYWRTLGYFNLIDDAVPMKDTLYVVPTSTPGPQFFVSKPHVSKRYWAIGVHMLNTCLVYLILGGKAALLFAVFPICVNNVAWITGSYYSTATFLTLSAYYFLTHTPWFISIPLSMAFFAAALNATLVTISFPFVFLFANPIGLCLLFPLAMFLKGNRFTKGREIREKMMKPANTSPDIFDLRRVVVCIKVIGKYVYHACFPYRLAFFHKFGNNFLTKKSERDELESINIKFFLAIGLIVAFLGLGFVVGKLFWAIWFLVLIAAFSQYRILGQFFAERYMYPALVGFVAVAAALPDQMYWVLVGAYIVRTHMHIPVFESNRSLYENGTSMVPEEPANWCNLSDWHLLVEPDLSLAGFYAQATMKVDPEDFKPNVNMSSLFMVLKQYPFALDQARIALKKADGKVSDQFLNIIANQIIKIQELMKNETTQQPNAV